MTQACFVTATDTDVGKTLLAATIVAGLVVDGISVRARKPIVTGVNARAYRPTRPGPDDDLADLPDHELLATLSGEHASEVATVCYEPAVSPHLAAELAGARLDVEAIVSELRALAERREALVVEGIGGLLVPLAPGWDVRRLAAELRWPVLIAARPGLGTINHTLLTLEAARSVGLDVRAIVLTPWPHEPGTLERSNRETLERLGAVEVGTLPLLEAITRSSLASAAATLPYERWLAA